MHDVEYFNRPLKKVQITSAPLKPLKKEKLVLLPTLSSKILLPMPVHSPLFDKPPKPKPSHVMLKKDLNLRTLLNRGTQSVSNLHVAPPKKALETISEMKVTELPLLPKSASVFWGTRKSTPLFKERRLTEGSFDHTKLS